jgi:hypothetical protein
VKSHIIRVAVRSKPRQWIARSPVPRRASHVCQVAPCHELSFFLLCITSFVQSRLYHRHYFAIDFITLQSCVPLISGICRSRRRCPPALLHAPNILGNERLMASLMRGMRGAGLLDSLCPKISSASKYPVHCLTPQKNMASRFRQRMVFVLFTRIHSVLDLFSLNFFNSFSPV